MCCEECIAKSFVIIGNTTLTPAIKWAIIKKAIF